MTRQNKSHTALFRFYEELNDFLPREHHKCDIVYRFSGSPAVKDTIEAQGVPHTEVDLILVNGVSVGFDHRITDGDRVSVYPMFESIDIGPISHLRPVPLRTPRFILDVHLGRLAGYLRLLGFDSTYERDLDDHAIVARAAREQRIILSRDRGLLKHGSVTRGYWVRSQHPREQACEVVRRFDLAGRTRPFSRCMRCNGLLQNVNKSEILHLLKPDTERLYNQFTRCIFCGRIYWEGSHYMRMRALIGTITDILPEVSDNQSGTGV